MPLCPLERSVVLRCKNFDYICLHVFFSFEEFLIWVLLQEPFLAVSYLEDSHELTYFWQAEEKFPTVLVPFLPLC